MERSPTEIIDDDDKDLEEEGDTELQEAGPGGTSTDLTERGAMNVDDVGGSPGRSKRARDAGLPSNSAAPAPRRDRRERRGADDDPAGDDVPVTSREFRALLNEHFQSMTANWAQISSRLGGVEKEAVEDRKVRAVLSSRVTQVERKGADLEVKVHQLTKAVEDIKQEAAAKKREPQGDKNDDPWAEYYKANRIPFGPGNAGPAARPDAPPPPGGSGPNGAPLGREELTEEDKRMLIIGGWSQDTKKQVIIEEGGEFLKRAEIAELLDQDELLVWGPRRSFGVLKFKIQNMAGTRDRMWKVIQNLRARPVHLRSTTAGGGEGKVMWASFTKTREARKRSAHGSLIRRVCTGLVKDAMMQREAHNPQGAEEGSYDVDWNSGTVWMGEWKIGSSTHRHPRGDSVKLLSSGWIDIMAMAHATGVVFDTALRDTTECFTWLSHQSPGQWRGVGVGISHDLYDSWTDRIAFNKGAAWVVRLRNHRRLILGSLHLPTGVSTSVYHKAVQEFRHALARWHPDLPCCLGVDVNEVVLWTHADESEADGNVPLSSGAKIDKFLEAVSNVNLRLCPPRYDDRWKPTHYPRDASRSGRHIDAVTCRLLSCSSVVVNEDVRFHINTDHARMDFDIELQCTKWGRRRDTRAKWVNCEHPLPEPGSWEEVRECARRHTAPRKKGRYRDDVEVKEAIQRARAQRDEAAKLAWKEVHYLRRKHKRAWQRNRVSRVLSGDWLAYRDIQAEKKKRNWWGKLLSSKSSCEVAGEVEAQLKKKVWVEDLGWDDQLSKRISSVCCWPGWGWG
ncbi:unnamed protein product [Symbiodinium sp. CCMP2456]|nr:unnamed protein product [Symbiodinium sp. CCMP2456]